MRRTARILSVILILALVFTLTACNKDQGAGKEDRKIVVGYSTIAYSLAELPQFLYRHLEDGCKARGWDFLPLAAEGDVTKQGEQVQQLIQQKPDVMVLFPGDPQLAVDWVKDINAAGIPVINLHTDVAEAGRQYSAAFVGADNYNLAANIAKVVIDTFGKDAGINIVQIGGVPVQADMIQRQAGFNDTIAAGSNFNILGIEWAFSSRADAQGFMENFISTYGDSIDVLYGLTDNLTLGGMYALQAAGMTDVKIYSITGFKEVIAAIKAGTFTLTAQTHTKVEIDKVMELLDKLVAGQKIDEYFQYMDTPFITKENADKFEGEF